MPHKFANQNLDQYEQQSWTEVYTTLLCSVQSVYKNQNGGILVNVITVRQGIPFVRLSSATSTPSVGDIGVIVFADGRRDTPIYFGVSAKTKYPLVAYVVASSSTLVDVTITGIGRLNGIPYVGTQPSVGNSGLVTAVGGDASILVYIGTLSSIPEAVIT